MIRRRRAVEHEETRPSSAAAHLEKRDPELLSRELLSLLRRRGCFARGLFGFHLGLALRGRRGGGGGL